MIAFFSTKYKWDQMREGPLSQKLPDWTPGREFISDSRADFLKIPYTEGEALVRLEKMVKKLDATWLNELGNLRQQKELLISILRLGAYSLPAAVLQNAQIDLHLQDFLKKDLIRCCKEIRLGNLIYSMRIIIITHVGLQFDPPAQGIQMLLNNYVRVSADYLPYAFYSSTKLSAYAVTNAAETPQSTVRLNADNGAKFYKKVGNLVIRHQNSNKRRDC